MNRYFLGLWLALWLVSGQAASALSDTLKVTAGVTDYGPLIQSKLLKLAEQGGGTLYIRPGSYPVLSAAVVDFQSKPASLAVVGMLSRQGKRPELIDTDVKRDPHSFLAFVSHIEHLNLSVQISNLAFRGNNIPYSPTHPFFNNPKKSYSSAISILNSRTARVTHCSIDRVYGNGIAITNWLDNKKKLYRCESPVVLHTTITNTWAHNIADDTGDGIVFLSCNKPRVENCLITNDLTKDKMFGRGAIVVEHYCEKSIIRNNRLTGFMRTIHLECDYGGHLIEKNVALQCDNGVVFSLDCGQQPADYGKYSKSIVRNNSFTFSDETNRFNLPKGGRSFISFWVATPVLKGLVVENNKFYWGAASDTIKQVTAQKRKGIMFDFKGQDPEIIQRNNTLQLFDNAGGKTGMK